MKQPHPNLHRLAYVSVASRETGLNDLKDILGQCRRNNPEMGLTGLLLYDDGYFWQLLEGAPAMINAMLVRLRNDRRHYNLRILIDEPVAARMFAGFSMACPNVEDFEDVMGLKEVFEQATSDAEDNGDASRDLVRGFSEKGPWRPLL